MIIYIDIDNTICDTDSDCNYNESTPIYKNIDKVKLLIEQGHEVSFWTARGTVSGIDWGELTKKQLTSWGLGDVPIIFGKPNFDLFIDDKVMNVENWE